MVESTGATHSAAAAAAAAAFTPAVWAGVCFCADVAFAAAGWHPTMGLKLEHDIEVRQILPLLLQQLPFSQVFFSFPEMFFPTSFSGCLVISAMEME
jgi:hypothetical protein